MRSSPMARALCILIPAMPARRSIRCVRAYEQVYSYVCVVDYLMSEAPARLRINNSATLLIVIVTPSSASTPHLNMNMPVELAAHA